MKQMFRYTLWIMFVLILTGCTLASREIFDLEYQDSKILKTLEKGPFRSLEVSGAYNQTSHDVWAFDIVNMEATTYTVEGTSELNKITYTFDVIEDRSMQEGVIRLYGSGADNDKYFGISSLTNAHGAFLKINIQEDIADAILNAAKKPFWEYVTDPTIFRANDIYTGKTIVSLGEDGFWDADNYDYIIPRASSTSVDATFTFEQGTVRTDAVTGDVTTTLLPLITLETTTLVPANTEIYGAKVGTDPKHIGIEFSPDSTISTTMKFVIKGSFEEAKDALTSPTSTLKFGWDLIENAKINNKVIRSLSEFEMVKLIKVKPPVADLKDADYFWDKTDELTFDADNMTLGIITTLHPDNPELDFGVTNFLSFDLKMTKKYDQDGVEAGIFTIKGFGKYDNLWGVIRAIPGDKPGTMYADFTTSESSNAALIELKRMTETDVAAPDYTYQDKVSARRPYRLAVEMKTVGESWVRLNQDATGSMSYEPRETEQFTFIDTLKEPMTKRRLDYSLSSGGSTISSQYTVEVVVDNNKTNGVFLLQGFRDGNLSIVEPMHGRYIAIDRGSELYKTQAKYAIGLTLEEAQSALSKVLLFNLHEKSTLPNNHRVITAMQTHKTWVAMIYKDPTTGDNCAPGVVPPNLAPDTFPIYVPNVTFELDFDTETGVEVRVRKVSRDPVDPEEPAFSGTSIYTLEVAQEFNPTKATFQLKIKSSGADVPNWNNQYIAIETGSGLGGNKGYIALGALKENAEDNLALIKSETKDFYNFHAKNSAPKNATVVDTIKGISYIQSDLDTSLKPSGVFTPYKTRYYKFSFNPLLLTITTTNEDGFDKEEEYALETVDDGGKFRGIVKLKGETFYDFNDYFMRIDVQRVGGTGVFTSSNAIRITTHPNNPANLETSLLPIIGDNKNFKREDITHINNTVRPQVRTAIDTLINIKETWTAVNAIDKMDDYKNGLQLKFEAAPVNTVTITDLNNLVGNPISYPYEVMENNRTSATAFDSVIRLGGGALLRDQYIALTYQTPKTSPNSGGTPPATDGVAFAFGLDYNTAKRQLTGPGIDAYIPYADPYPAGTETLKAFTSYISYPNGGYGTPSFVWMKGGAYIPTDTETWTFDLASKIVTISHNGTSQVKRYNVYMLSADPVLGTDPNFSRAEALFYLRSELNTDGTDGVASTDPYNKKYVEIDTHTMTGAVNTTDPTASSKFIATISKNRDMNNSDGKNIVINMQDLHSADVAARALNLAKAHPWVRLTPNNSQLNKDDFEKWEFTDTKITVTTVTAIGETPVDYQFAPMSDTSSHRGTFLLTGAGSYDNHIVAISIGGEITTPPNVLFGDINDSTSMRLASALNSGVNSEANAMTARDALSEWNFRKQSLAELPFTPIITAQTYDPTSEGWVALRGTDFAYEGHNTERWIFDPILNLENAAGSTVHDILISGTSTTPNTTQNRFGIKLISTTANRAEFRIFRGNNPTGRSNKFVVLEVGSGLDEKLMRVGMGDSLQDAQNNFDDLGSAYNWSTYTRATADNDLGDAAAGLGRWSLTRGNNSTISTGSATSSSGTGHFLNGTFPKFTPTDVLEYEFDFGRGRLSIHNHKVDVVSPDVYAMEVVVNPTANSVIYKLTDGISEYKNKFLYLEFNGTPDIALPDTMRARASVANTIIGVKNLNAGMRNTWNLFASESIKEDGSVFIEAAGNQRPTTAVSPSTLGAHVALATGANVYDTTLTKSYTIIPTDITTTDGTIHSAKTIIISNMASDNDLGPDGNKLPRREDTYSYEMVESDTSATGQHRAIALLRGSGPDNNKHMGIRLSSDVSEAVITVGSMNDVKSFLKWTDDAIPAGDKDDLFRYRIEKSVSSKSSVLEQLGTKALVSLDADNIYLDNDTIEWTFDAADLLTPTLTATASERKPDGSTSAENYKTIKVKTTFELIPTDIIEKGIIYLSGSGRFHGYYAAVIKNTTGIRFYPVTTLANAMAIIATPPAENLTLKDTVHFPRLEPAITIVTTATAAALDTDAGWKSLNTDFTQDKTTAIQLKFLANRVVKIKIGSAGTETTHRFKPVYDESVGTTPTTDITKAMIQLVQVTGGDTIPLVFSDKTIALDVITLNNPDAIRLVALTGINITAGTLIADLIAARDVNLDDPNYILAKFFDTEKTSLIKLQSVSTRDWRMVDGNDALLGATGDTITDWETIYNVNSKDAPWAFTLDGMLNDGSTIKVSRSSKAKSSIEPLDVTYEYLTKMISHDGANTGIFRMYRGKPDVKNNNFYTAEISNKYYAFKVGENTDHFRARIASADTADGARTALNELAFENLTAYERWVSPGTAALTRMNLNQALSVSGIQEGPNWGQWVDTTGGVIDPKNHTYITFNHIPALNDPLTMSVVTLKDLEVESAAVYSLTLIQNINSTSAIYSVAGIGSLSGTILAFDRPDTTVSKDKSRIFFTTTATKHTYAAAKAGLQALTTDNYQEKRTLLTTFQSINSAITVGPVVSVDNVAYALTPSVKVLNLRDNKSWQFSIEGTTQNVLVTTTVAGVVTAINYSIVMVEDTTTKGLFQLNNKKVAGAILDDKYVVMHINGTGDQHIRLELFDLLLDAETAFNATAVPVLTATTAHFPIPTFATEYKVAAIADDKILVTLDKDFIYLDHETQEFKFDVSANSVNVITRDEYPSTGSAVNRSDNYFLNPVLGMTGSSTTLGEIQRALYYLKASKPSENPPLHDTFVAFEVQSSHANTDTSGLVGKEVLYGKFIANKNAAIDGTALTAAPINIAIKDAIYVNDSTLLAYEAALLASTTDRKLQGMGMLASAQGLFEYNPLKTEEIYLDVKRRLILYVHKSSTSVPPIQETNYYRIKLQHDNVSESTAPAGSKKFTWQMVINTRNDLKFRNESGWLSQETGAVGTPPQDSQIGSFTPTSAKSREKWYWAFSIPSSGETTGIWMGYAPNYTGLGWALAARRNAVDPKVVPLNILKTEPQVSITAQQGLLDGNDWYIPIDDDRVALPGSATSTDNFAFRTPERSPGSSTVAAVHNFEMSTRNAIDGTEVDGLYDATAADNTRALYLTKVIGNTGSTRGVFLPHGVGAGSTPKVQSIFEPVISNKYVAMEVGSIANEKRVKLAVGNSQVDAEQKLQALTYWNYATRSVLRAKPTIVTNLASELVADDRTWVYSKDGLLSIYTHGNTRDFNFTQDGALSIKDTGTGTVESYDILMIEGTTATDTGLFQLIGRGGYNEQYMSIEITRSDTVIGLDGLPMVATTVKFGIGTTIASAKAHLLTTAAKLFEIGDTIDTGKMFAFLKDKTIVETTKVGTTHFYDPKDVYEYTFLSSITGGGLVSITKKTGGQSITHQYKMGLAQDGLVEGYYTLEGTTTSDPDHGAIIGIKGSGASLDTQAYFKILVTGRKFGNIKPTAPNTVIPGGGVPVPEGIVALEAEMNTIDSLNIERHLIFKPTNILNKLQGIGAIGSLSTGSSSYIPSGNFDVLNHDIYNFNETAHTLQMTRTKGGSKSFFNYDISIVEGTGTAVQSTGVLYAVGRDTSSTGAGSPLHNKFINVNLIDDDRYIITRESTVVAAKDLNIELMARKTQFEFGYWTHEVLDNIDIQNRFIDRMRDLSLNPQTLVTMPNWNINEATSIETKNGLVMLTDDRFFSANGLVNDAGSRVLGEGFFDKLEYYSFRVNEDLPNGAKVDSMQIAHGFKNTSGAPDVQGSLAVRIKVLEQESATRGTFMLVTGSKPNGDLEDTSTTGPSGAESGGRGNTETKGYFENAILSINIDEDGRIILGHAKPADASRTAIVTAMNAAKTERNTLLADPIKKYTPNIVGEYIARQQHFVPYILSGDPYKTFVDGTGLEVITSGIDSTVDLPGFSYRNKQLIFKFLRGENDSFGPTNTYHAELSLKDVNHLNSSVNSDNEESGTENIKVQIQVLKLTETSMVFKMHSPVVVAPGTSSELLDADWKNMIFDKYHAIKLGTRGNLFQFKWVYGTTAVDALNQINGQLGFFHGASVWTASEFRRETINARLINNTFTINGSSLADQRLGDITVSTPTPSTLTFVIRETLAGNLVMTVTGDGAVSTSYELFPKDLPPASNKWVFGVSDAIGSGGFSGYTILIAHMTGLDVNPPLLPNGSHLKMIWVKPGSGLEFVEIVNQFIQDKSASSGPDQWNWTSKDSNLSF